MSEPVAATSVRKGGALPYAAILGTVLIWGLSFASSKTILNTGVPPMTMVALRFAVASVILLPLLRLREPATRLRRPMVVPLLVGGLLGVTVYFFFESRGIRLTTASSASLITATIPVLTVVAERLFYNARVPWYRWIGVLVSVAGVYLLVGSSREGAAEGALAGNLLMLGACFAWVAYNMVSRNMHRSYSDFAVTAYQTVFGAVFLVPLALAEAGQWVPLGWVALANILFLAVASSALAYFLYLYALARLGPVGTTPFVNLIPLVGVLGGVVILGETVSAMQLAGGAVAIVGVVVVSLRPAQGRGPKGPAPP
jgi:drug/metabolite transporter (DMT)-like permease